MSKLFATTLLIYFISFRISCAQWQIAAGPSMMAPNLIASLDSIILVATPGGLYKSTDEGINWTVKNVGAITNTFSCMRVLDSVIFLGTNGSITPLDDGVFKSTDFGETWTKCKNGRIYQILSTGNKLYITSSGGFQSTLDYGLTWQPESSSINVTTITSGANQLFGYYPFVGIYSRQDSDTAWSALSLSGITDLDFKSIVSNDSVICIATTGDFFITYNLGNTWVHPSNLGIINSPITSLFLDSNFIYGSTNGYLIRSQNWGNTWDTISYTAPLGIAKHQNMLLLGNQFGLKVSDDQGANWTDLFSVNTLSPIKSLATKDSIILASSSNSIYYSSDEGNHWDKTTLNSGSINCLLTVDSIVIAGTLSGTGIFKRNWNDTSWTTINNGLTNLSIRSLIRSGNVIYSGTSYGLFSSSNLGQSWTDIGSNLPDKYIYSILVDSSRIFVGTPNGVYFTQNNGSSWTKATIAIPAGTAVQTLAIKDSIILAGTFGYGVFVSTNGGLSWSASNSGFTGSNYFIRFIYVVGSIIYTSLTSQVSPTTGLLFLSTDNGASWTFSPPIVNGVNYNKVNALAYDYHNLYAVSNSGFLLKEPLSQLNNACASVTTAKAYVCENDSLLLSANIGPGFTYQWLRQGVPISGATNQLYYAKQSGQYSCTFGGGCVGTSTPFTLFGKAAPQPTISPVYVEICPQGDSTMFSVDNPLPSYTYQWKNALGLIPGAIGASYYAKALGNYYCIVEDSFQCKGVSNPVLLGYSPYADSVITAQGNTKICPGDSVQLLANNGVGTLHQWKFNGIDLPADTLAYCYAKFEGVYMCLMTNACHTNSIPITISYTPVANFIAHQDSATPTTWRLEESSDGISTLSYSWDWGDFTPPDSGLSVAHLYPVTATYNVCLTVTDTNGCSATHCDSLYASVITIVIPLTTPELSLNSSDEIMLFPIPLKERLEILSKTKVYSEVRLYDVLGKLIYQEKFEYKTSLSTSALAEGIYIIELSNSRQSLFKKVIKYKH